VPAEAAEHVRLTGQVGRDLRLRARVEHEGDRQGAQVVRRGRRTVVAGRIVAVDDAVARRAAQTIIETGGALATRCADRAGLDEGPAGAARAVGVRDAAEVRVRAAHARARLAGAREGAVPIGAARRVGGLPATRGAAARVVGAAAAGAGARRARGDGATATGTGAVATGVGPAAAPHR